MSHMSVTKALYNLNTGQWNLLSICAFHVTVYQECSPIREAILFHSSEWQLKVYE